MNTQSFVLYESAYKQIEIIEKRLGKEAAYNFIKDIMQFGLYGVIPQEDSDSWLYGFEQTITSIANAKSKYEAAVENGKKGGRPKKQLNETEVYQKKRELGTWKAVAAYYKVSEQTLKNYRLEWEENQKNPKNLNDNDNVNDNVNMPSALANARLESGQSPDTPQQQSNNKIIEITIESPSAQAAKEKKESSTAGTRTWFNF